MGAAAVRNRVLSAAALTILAALALLSAATTAATPAGASAPVPELAVEGTAFVLRQPDGTELRGPQLVGAELDLGDGVTLRIDAVRPDPGDKSGETLLHALSTRGAGGAWVPLCDADREGKREGFPVPGRWDDAGRYHPDGGHFALTCTSGAQAKCVRFGYKPWKPAPDGASLVPLYEACVHMVRADYCGDGVATTREGTQIDIFDRHGVQRPESGPELRFEAGWSPTGAVCVAHTRIPENVTLDQLRASCPRLAAALGSSCTEEAAAKLGAVLFNRSR
ncbi:MAG TPA: ADYC domain-containing protein [Thermoanaerobaculia bacterium]|nr:ADYC domain-containing protein [Thermoanaerobaculia bacterium]